MQTAYALHTTVHVEALYHQGLEASAPNRTSSPVHTPCSEIVSDRLPMPPASFVFTLKQLGTTELMKLPLKWCGTFQTPIS